MRDLPRGIRIDHGYVQIRIMSGGTVYHRNFGRDCAYARELAAIHLAEKRKEILMGKFGIVRESPSRRFDEAARLWFGIWSVELDGEGRPAHGGAKETGRVIESVLIPYFGKMRFDAIKPADVIRWRAHQTKTTIGTTANRYQAVLSSIFGHIARWVQNETIEAFRLPTDPGTGKVWNPCASVEKAANRKRKRVLSLLELRGLKAACIALNDPDMWELCCMGLMSLLRKKDLFRLEAGLAIDIQQAKTKRGILLPVAVDKPLNSANFRNRWRAARAAARLEWPKNDPRNVEFRDLRKTGANLLKERNHSMKLISELLGHATQRTTEIYMVENADHLKPLVDDMRKIIESI